MAISFDGGRSGTQGEISCETDRARFIGRGRTPASRRQWRILPAFQYRRFRSGSDHLAAAHGHVWRPDETVRIDFVMGVTESRDAALALVGKIP